MIYCRKKISHRFITSVVYVGVWTWISKKFKFKISLKFELKIKLSLVIIFAKYLDVCFSKSFDLYPTTCKKIYQNHSNLIILLEINNQTCYCLTVIIFCFTAIHRRCKINITFSNIVPFPLLLPLLSNMG